MRGDEVGLSDQAWRMLKTSWHQNAQLLAEELYLMLLQDTDPAPAKVAVDPGEGAAPFVIPTEGLFDPLGGLTFPDFDLPDFGDDNLSNPADLTQEDQEDSPNQTKRTKTTTKWVRSVLPGQVTAKDGDIYAVNLYPNGTDEAALPVDGVTALTGTAKANDWVLVFRVTKLEVKKTEILESGPGLISAHVISTDVKFKVKKRRHLLFPRGSAGGGGVPVKITDGTGDTYTGDAYPDGTDGDATVGVSIKVLQIDPDEVIPPDTWLIAARIGDVYYVQPPIFLGFIS